MADDKAAAAFLGGLALFFIELVAQVSGYTNATLAIVLWGGAAVLLGWAAWRTWRDSMEPWHLILIGTSGAAAFALIAVAGVIWQHYGVPALTPLAAAPPPATYSAQGGAGGFGAGGGGAAAGPNAMATGGGSSGIMNPEALLQMALTGSPMLPLMAINQWRSDYAKENPANPKMPDDAINQKFASWGATMRIRTHDDGSMEFYQTGQAPDVSR